MARSSHAPRSGFTLIELLVVMVVIAILAGLLIPILGMVRERTQRVACANHFRQCGLALMAFAGDRADQLPRPRPDGVHNPDTYFVVGSGYPSMVALMQGYLDGFAIWRCPSTRGVAIDDPANLRSDRRSNLIYWPWLAEGTFASPGRLARHDSTTVLMQDQLYTWGGGWRANHSRSGVRKAPYADNPSLHCAFDGTPTGVNILFGDGRVAWIEQGPKLVKVYAPGPSDIYSVAPALP